MRFAATRSSTTLARASGAAAVPPSCAAARPTASANAPRPVRRSTSRRERRAIAPPEESILWAARNRRQLWQAAGVTAGAPVARIHVASFRRDGVEILRHVRWTIRAGEHWAVLGPNGSGKTSLLQILAAVEWPSEGEVEVLGEKFGGVDLRELRKLVGVVGAALEERLPGWEEAQSIVLSGMEASIGLNRAFDAGERQRALAALEALSAGNLARRPFRVLSHGARQRVLIARAFVHRPPPLGRDEPREGPDPPALERPLAGTGPPARHPEPPTT